MSLLQVPPSPKKQALYDVINNSRIKVGDHVGVKDTLISQYTRRPDEVVNCLVIAIDGDKLTVRRAEGNRYSSVDIYISDVVSRELFYVGADPFINTYSDVRTVNYTLESILFNLNITGHRRSDHEMYRYKDVVYTELNWNPFVVDKDGNRQYYQRPFVWSVADNQLLIDSIYNDIECGRVLVRKRSFKEMDAMVDAGITEVGFHDIVDGKQRLNALRGFILGEYPDSHGNYYADLSNAAQLKLGNNQLIGYAELPENCPDATVIQQFLKLNFAGVPQSKEHIQFVKELLTKI